jgi:integrase/recombinase XerD
VPFYNNDTKWDHKATLSSGLRDGIITPDDNGLIVEYLLEKQARDHIGIRRVNKIATILVNFQRFIPQPYRTATIGDVYAGITNLQSGKSLIGKPFKQNTINTYIRIVKPFLLWLVENDYNKLPEKKLQKIKAPPVDRHTTNPDEIITTQEILDMLTACQNSRDRALLSTLYESGCRIGELALLTWRDLIFDKYGVRLYITDTKTKKRRYARLTMSLQYLSTWKCDTTDSFPDARVFVNLKSKEPLEYYTVVRLLERVRSRAGISRRITPHLFRKSRITHMVAQNYQESVIKQSMWGNLSTEMFSTYVCLAEQDIDAEILDKAGIERKSDIPNPLAPIPCPNCHHVNPPTSDWCNQCGMALSTTAVASVRGVLEYAIAHPDTASGFFAEKQDPPKER